MLDCKLYVGTWGKYAAGSLKGDWVSLLDYETLEDFYAACRELHNDEEDPELMFQDYEGEDFDLYEEGRVSEELFTAIHEAAHSCYDPDVIRAYISLFEPSLEELKDLDDSISSCYVGYFDSDSDLGYYYANELGGIQIPEEIEPYFDFDMYGRDLALDLYHEDGHYFWR